jgi:hypothetical protein
MSCQIRYQLNNAIINKQMYYYNFWTGLLNMMTADNIKLYGVSKPFLNSPSQDVYFKLKDF